MQPDMATVDVSIPVDRSAAAALDNPVTRALAGRVISRMLEPSNVEALTAAIAALKAEAHARGLTDEIVDAELESYNAERRTAPPGA